MFTDIEGSTRLLTALGERYVQVLDDHRAIVRSAVAAFDGTEVDTQGDAFFMVFTDPGMAVGAAVEVQRRLAHHPWPNAVALTVRIGVHTGTPQRTAEGYVGIDLHRGARICAAGHGGQVVVSDGTRAALGDAPVSGGRLRALGAHQLKDIDEPLTLFDVCIDGLTDTFPALRTLGARPTNLAPESQEVIGREGELAAIRAALMDGPTRLITLVGPGGIGKTTLALRLAADLLPDFADGVFAVLLAPVAGADRVATAISDALNLRDQPGRSHLDVVVDYLARREVLLVFDNFEHVIDAAPVVERLLAGAPRCRVVVTSRLALRITEEREYPVSTLAVAATATARPGDRSAAVELFVRRAQAVRPGFRLDGETATAVTEICARLDGLPLAIELAAARVRLMPPTAMLARLERPLELAAHGPRHRPTRQQALRAAIDWSHDLLSAPEQRAMARLGIFAGPFTLEAAEEICEVSLDDLAGLLDHSLLRSADQDAFTDGRLTMLETIRAYARERLEASGERERTRDRHADWYRALVRPTDPQLLQSSNNDELLRTLDPDQNDLRAALEWLLVSGRGEDALQLADDLGVYWDTRGQYAEACSWYQRTLAAASSPTPRDRATALFFLGRMASITGEVSIVQPSLQEALTTFRALNDARGTVLCLSHIAWRSDAAAGAEELPVQALMVARASGDAWSIAVALNNLANSLLDEGRDLPRIRTLLEESLAIRRRLGEKRTLSITLSNVGRLCLLDGRLADAAAILDEASAYAIDLGFESIVIEARQALARMAFITGDLVRAESLLADTLERSERVGDLRGRAGAFYGLARIAAERGDDVAAGARNESADALSRSANMGWSRFEQWLD